MAEQKFVTLGECEICGQPIEVAEWVVKKAVQAITTCSRVCQNVKLGRAQIDLDED